jgi:DNA-binding MarR family transcriptional regulator
VSSRNGARSELIGAVNRAGRENSDASVMFHTAVAMRLGLNASDSKTIGILKRLGPITAGELARETGLAAASVTGLVDRLVEKGFVRRVRDGRDRRRVVIEPVLDRVSRVFPAYLSLQRAMAKLCGHYSDTELHTIVDFLDRSAVLLRDETVKVTAKKL